MNAKQSLSSISANQELWVEQFRQEMFERDIRSGLSTAENLGLERGRKECITKGRAEGKQERNIALAKNTWLWDIPHRKQLTLLKLM